jgi:hypothetical protein
LRQIYPKLVTESETVFTGEVSQWGQFVVSADQKIDKGDLALQALFNNVELTDEQRASMQSILNAGKPNSDMSVTSTVVKQVTATTQPPAAASVPVAPTEPLPMDSIDLAALEAAAASEVETPMAQESLVDVEGLNAAAASEVNDDDEDIPGLPPVDDKSDTAVG